MAAAPKIYDMTFISISKAGFQDPEMASYVNRYFKTVMGKNGNIRVKLPPTLDSPNRYRLDYIIQCADESFDDNFLYILATDNSIRHM